MIIVFLIIMIVLANVMVQLLKTNVVNVMVVVLLMEPVTVMVM
jgi:hypothetical protein